MFNQCLSARRVNGLCSLHVSKSLILFATFLPPLQQQNAHECTVLSPIPHDHHTLIQLHIGGAQRVCCR